MSEGSWDILTFIPHNSEKEWEEWKEWKAKKAEEERK